MSGVPVFKGTRVPVESLFQTETIGEFVEVFPPYLTNRCCSIQGAGRLITLEKCCLKILLDENISVQL